jgi:hypothetical protein
MSEDHGQRIYLITSIADPDNPTPAELADGIDLTKFIVEEVSFGFDGSAQPGGRVAVVRGARVRPAKIIDGETVEPANRAERRDIERHRRADPPPSWPDTPRGRR